MLALQAAKQHEQHLMKWHKLYDDNGVHTADVKVAVHKVEERKRAVNSSIYGKPKPKPAHPSISDWSARRSIPLRHWSGRAVQCLSHHFQIMFSSFPASTVTNNNNNTVQPPSGLRLIVASYRKIATRGHTPWAPWPPSTSGPRPPLDMSAPHLCTPVVQTGHDAQKMRAAQEAQQAVARRRRSIAEAVETKHRGRMHTLRSHFAREKPSSAVDSVRHLHHQMDLYVG